MTSRTCDLRFSLQGRYASVLDLSAFDITNTAVTIHGYALHAGHGGQGITEEEFINYAVKDDGKEIKDRLITYLGESGLNFGRNHLVILDMEPGYVKDGKNIRFPPAGLGRYEGIIREENGELMQDELIKAYSQRITIAREVLLKKWPTVKIGLYGVVVPDGKGQEDEIFLQRMRGYRRARKLGMFDHVDCLVPILYTRFGESDSPADIEKLHGWIEESARQAITNSRKLTRRKGKTISLAPILTFWVLNGNSKHHEKAILPQTMGLKMRILRSYRSVEMIVMWSGKETKEEMESDPDFKFEILDISNFLDNVDEIPLAGCK